MLELIDLNKVYVNSNNVRVHALKDINLKLGEKGFTFIVGPSGGGKSTLLNVIGGLDGFDSGQMLIKGVDSHQLNERALDSYRNTYVGFVFQEYNLLDHLTLAENVALAVELKNQRPSKEEISAIFEELGIGGLENRYPNEISGGQRQRVAIARVLIKKPAILFADEPAGSVDKDSRKYIYDTLKKLSKDILVVAVTHNADIPYIYADRIITVDDGRIVNDEVLTGDPTFAETYGKGEVMVVEPNKTLNHLDVENLNNYLASKKDKELYICVEEKLKSVETLHPKVAESIKKNAAKKAEQAKKLAAKEATTTETTDTASEPFQLVKAKLPAKSAWRMVKTHFGSGKLRTIFTIILTALAISFFAVSTILTGFNGKQANIKAFTNSNNPYITMQDDKLLTLEDVGAIKQKSSDVASAQAALIYNFGTGRLQVDAPTTPTVKIDKFIRLNKTETDKTVFGQKLIKNEEVKSEWAKGEFDIVVSDYIADQIVTAKNLTNMGQVIGEKLDGKYTIVGIYETNYSNIKNSTDEHVIKQRNNLIDGMYATVYVSDSFNTVSSGFGKGDFQSNVRLGVQGYQDIVTTSASSKNIAIKLTTEGTAKVPSYFGSYVDAEGALTLMVTTSDKTLVSVKLPGVEVAEAPATEGATEDLVLPQDQYELIRDALINPSTAIALGRSFTVNQLTDIMDTYETANFLSVNSAEIEEFAYRFGVVGNAFLVTSIILGMFAVLLLYNFVSQSVRTKRKNIGILRAIGAGMKDIFGIFMIEAALLALFIILGSYTVTIVATIIANAVVQAGALYGLTVFGFNFLTFVWMFVIAVVVSFVGYSVPLLTYTRIKPIEIITRKTGI